MRPALLTPEALRAALREMGVGSAAELGTRLSVSQPTVSRALAALGDEVLRIGRTRGARYALPQAVDPHGSRWPLYRIAADGRAALVGDLHSLAGGHWYLDSPVPRPALMQGEFARGLFPDLPWFLDDLRPQGFLGRSFVQAHAQALGAPRDLDVWTSRHVLAALLLHGSDLPGDLVLGDAALQSALHSAMAAPDALDPGQRTAIYPQRALTAIAGERVGSSAGGEQPKFTVLLREGPGYVSAVVKFSEPPVEPSAVRWSDLLLCEHLAGEVLSGGGLPAAPTELVDAGGRRFLQSTRHDRTPTLGRRGQVSLRALDAAHFGVARRPWTEMADTLSAAGWLAPDSAEQLRVIGLFGELIGNTDMHFGNLAFELVDAPPLAIVPVFDMLPMLYAPGQGGALAAREFAPPAPLPRHAPAWSRAATLAETFWARLSADVRASEAFRGIAADNRTAIVRLFDRYG